MSLETPKLPLHRRLAFKQTKNIILVAFLIGLMLTIGQLTADFYQQRSNHNSDVQRTLSTAIKSAQFAAYNLDDATAQEIVAGLLNSRFIIQASIQDNYGNTLARARKSPDKVSDLGRWLFGDLKNIKTDLQHETSNYVGALYLQVDPATHAESFIQRSVLTFLFGIIRNIVLAACIMLVFYFGVTKSILLASQQVSRPGRSREIDIPSAHREDEIGMLLTAFNQQIKTIENQNEQILTSNKNLEAQVQERTSELEKEQQAALAASKAKSDFLAVMSHEIRTPMNGVLGLLKILSDSGLPPAQVKYVDSINDACESLLGLMNNALEYTRNEQGDLQLRNTIFDLERLLSSIIFLLSSSARKNQNQLGLHISDNVAKYIELDSERLRQVILNLINNAIKFTRDGEVHLSVTCTDKNERESLLIFVVSDTGVGIPENARDLIFSPYLQADKNIHAMYGGAGMGLAICKTIVEKMGGKISYNSREGEGSEFTVEIPVKVAKKMPTLDTQSKAVTSETMSVLVVDDVEMNLNLARWYFEKKKHRVHIADNGFQAIEVAQAKNPQAILMDVNMPGLDGIEATRELRTKCFSGLIYGVTAHVDSETKSRCYEAGMDGVIEKPVNYPELIGLLEDDIINLDAVLNDNIVHEHFSNLGLDPASQLYEKALEELLKNLQASEGVIVGSVVSKEQLHKLKGLAGNFGFQAMLDLFNHFNDGEDKLSASKYALWLKTLRITRNAINQYQPKKT